MSEVWWFMWMAIWNGRILLQRFPDQTFLQPGLFVLYTTPVVLVGKHEVRAIVDLEGMVVRKWRKQCVYKNDGKRRTWAQNASSRPHHYRSSFLNPRKKLAVTIANIGDSPLPLGGGNLKILVDGSLKGSYTLRSLSDASFLPPKEASPWTPLWLSSDDMKLMRVLTSSGRGRV